MLKPISFEGKTIFQAQKKLDIIALVILFIVALCLWTIAYQVRFVFSLAIGGDMATHRREDDAPFLKGFHASEPQHADTYEWWTLSPGYAYRWASSHATITLPGIGGNQWVVTIDAASGRPAGETATATWQMGEQLFPPIMLPAAPRSYHILAHTNGFGDLAIHMVTKPYRSSLDPRDLGIAVRGIRLAPVKSLFRPPAIAQIGWLLLTTMLLFSLCRWFELDIKYLFVLILFIIMGVTILLITHRFALTLFTPTLAVLVLSCGGIAIVARTILHNISISEGHGLLPLMGLFTLAFGLRLGGMLHPQAIFSDHRLNANNLLEVVTGEIYFTEGLPQEAGGGQSPYPPGTYLMMAPAQLVFPTTMDSRVLIVQSSVALLDSFVLVVIGMLLLDAKLGQRAALLGTLLYLLPPPMMKSFSIGEYANIGGQALALPSIALLAYYMHKHILSSCIFIALLSIGLLGHMGVAISLALLLIAWWLLNVGLAIYQGWKQTHWFKLSFFVPIVGFTRNVLFAALFVATFYYSAPRFTEIFANRLAEKSSINHAPSLSILEVFAHAVAGIFTPQSNLSPILVVCGLAGMIMLWQTIRDQFSFPMLLTTWWVGTLFSFGLLTIANQGVRWQHFLFPALCLGAGPFLATMVRHGRIGKVVAWNSIIFLLSHSLAVWVSQIHDYLH